MTVAIIVDWGGTFSSVPIAKEAATQNDLGEVLYLVIGKRRYQREARLQYVGISNDFATRF